MAYNKFTLNKLKTEFGLAQKKINFLPSELPVFVGSQKLLDELADALGTPMASEKAKSEFIVKPVLMELVRQNKHKITLFSGYTFDIDKVKKLIGRCDFMIAAQPYLEEIDAPMFCMVESKNGLIEDGFGQCAAEMYAARLFNEQRGISMSAIYGCATVGFSWAFLKLEQNTIYIEPVYVPLSLLNPNEVLAVLQWILNQSITSSK
jgi:hypothetical protein